MPLLRIGTRIITGRVSPTSFIGPLISLAGIVALTFLLVTGRIDLSKFDTGMSDTPETITQVATNGVQPTAAQPTGIQPVGVESPVQQVVEQSSDRIRLCSLNWQAVRAVTNHPQWLSHMATMLADFDVVAIQQIEPADYAAFQSLMSQLNQSSGRYGLSASEEVGSGNSRERLAFLWNQDRIMLLPESAYGILDDADRLLIEPYVASFEVRSGKNFGRTPFRFCLMNVHCRPNADASRMQAEWNVLSDVYLRVRQFEYDRRREDDVIFLGDFVSAESMQSPLLQSRTLTPTILSQRQAHSTGLAHEMLLDAAATREFTGRCGSFRLDQQLGLPISSAAAGALPVWAEFSTEELHPDTL